MSNTLTLVDLSVPSLGESVTEARIANWIKADGQAVGPDDVVAELETDKAAVELPAGASGVLHIVKAKGQTVNVGDVIARIERGAGSPATPPAAKGAVPSAPTPGASAPTPAKTAPSPTIAREKPASQTARPLAPAVERLVAENKLDPSHITPTGPGGRLTKGDVIDFMQERTVPSPVAPRAAVLPAAAAGADSSEETRVEISKLRETIARRLVEAQHSAAILSTFNEIDMSAVMALREKYKEKFEKTYQVGLGFLSFFARALCAAVKTIPIINAQMHDRAIVYKNHVHLGVAVATEKGLIVPVVRYADKLSMAQIEAEIKRLATRAREGKITLEELGGGTITITNGGVFGSLFSTPILNPPQSAILALHKIEKRAVVVNDQIVIRPMMYVALSYDHRLIDGQQAVTFLGNIKDALEDPARLLLEV